MPGSKRKGQPSRAALSTRGLKPGATPKAASASTTSLHLFGGQNRADARHHFRHRGADGFEVHQARPSVRAVSSITSTPPASSARASGTASSTRVDDRAPPRCRCLRFSARARDQITACICQAAGSGRSSHWRASLLFQADFGQLHPFAPSRKRPAEGLVEHDVAQKKLPCTLKAFS